MSTTQLSLIEEIETAKCPACGYEGDIDDFDCAGFPDGVLSCNNVVLICYWPRSGRKLDKGREVPCHYAFCVDDPSKLYPDDYTGYP